MPRYSLSSVVLYDFIVIGLLQTYLKHDLHQNTQSSNSAGLIDCVRPFQASYHVLPIIRAVLIENFHDYLKFLWIDRCLPSHDVFNT